MFPKSSIFKVNPFNIEQNKGKKINFSKVERLFYHRGVMFKKTFDLTLTVLLLLHCGSILPLLQRNPVSENPTVRDVGLLHSGVGSGRPLH